MPELAVPILMSMARECDFPLQYAAHAWPEEAATASGARRGRSDSARREYRNRAPMAAITVQRLAVCSLDLHCLRRLDRATFQDQLIRRMESPGAKNHET